jgi:hypothetical protein
LTVSPQKLPRAFALTLNDKASQSARTICSSQAMRWRTA